MTRQTTLIDNLTWSGNSPVALDAPDGSRALILFAYGRVIGLYAGDSNEDLLWTNLALAAAESAEAHFRRDGWLNPGGDRTWLVPEIELFIDDLARPWETYAVPPALDPGRWRRQGDTYGLRLSNESTVQLKRSGRRGPFRPTKEYWPAANPLRDMKPALSYAGFEQTTVLELAADLDDAPPVRLGLWNLLQLPKPGRMIVATYNRPEPRTVFGQVPSQDLALGERAFVWTMPDRGGNAKISVKVAALNGRAGYLYRSIVHAADWNLVVRNFAVNLSGDYVDALWSDPTDTGHPFQACAVNEGEETFSEFERQAPAAVSAEGRTQSYDRSQPWVFRGGSRKSRGRCAFYWESVTSTVKMRTETNLRRLT